MPRVVILGGVNGAGKTTAAFEQLTYIWKIPIFTNADALARGLNVLNPESVAIPASRFQLMWLDELARTKSDFAFETTLSARTYAPWLRKLKNEGYEVILVYYWLESAEIAVSRVQQRVKSGGHNIIESDIRRRYSRSIRNFFELYRPIADQWEVHDNSSEKRRLIAIGNLEESLIII